jgi:hypothetical protein
MSDFDILTSAISESGTVSKENMFELDKYEVAPQPQAQAQPQPQPPAQPITDNQNKSDSGGNNNANTSESVQQSVPLQEPSIDAMAYAEIIDAVVSRLMVVGCRFAGTSATVADFKLSEGEKKKIAPLVQKVAEKHMIYASIEVQLAIMALAMYGGRFLMVVTDDDKKISTKKKTPAKPKEPIESDGSLTRGRGRPRKI